MITEITEQTFTWECQRRTGKNRPPCGRAHTSRIDEAVYRFDGLNADGEPKAVIVLPPCTCTTHTTLKADYTRDELFDTIDTVMHDGTIWAYTMPLRYVRTLRLHWMLFFRGLAEHAPVLPLPEPQLLRLPQFAEIADPDIVASLWFGFLAARERIPELRGQSIMALLPPGKE